MKYLPAIVVMYSLGVEASEFLVVDGSNFDSCVNDA